LALPLLQLLLGGLCLSAFKSERHAEALRLWGWGLITGTAGVLLILTIEPLAYRVVGGLLITGASMACFAGAIGYKRSRLRRRYRIAGYITCIAPGAISVFWPTYFAIGQTALVITTTFVLLMIDLRKLESDMDRFATSDPITGLPNRRATLVRFKDEVARAFRHDRTFALVLLQLDRFEQIQQMRGGPVGDAAIRHVADIIRSAVRDEDVISRIGDDALVLILPEQIVEGSLLVANRLCERVAATPCRVDAWPLNLTLSRGVAVYPNDGHDWDTLHSVATRRMLIVEAKEGRRQKA
jgi:diguanylate cyclase (GGDEF)-like protein